MSCTCCRSGFDRRSILSPLQLTCSPQWYACDAGPRQTGVQSQLLPNPGVTPSLPSPSPLPEPPCTAADSPLGLFPGVCIGMQASQTCCPFVGICPECQPVLQRVQGKVQEEVQEEGPGFQNQQEEKWMLRIFTIFQNLKHCIF